MKLKKITFLVKEDQSYFDFYETDLIAYATGKKASPFLGKAFSLRDPVSALLCDNGILKRTLATWLDPDNPRTLSFRNTYEQAKDNAACLLDRDCLEDKLTLEKYQQFQYRFNRLRVAPPKETITIEQAFDVDAKGDGVA